MGVFLLGRTPDPDLQTKLNNGIAAGNSAPQGQATRDEIRIQSIQDTETDAAPTDSPPVHSAAAYEAYCRAIGTDVEKGVTSFDDRVRRDYRWHTVQYWFVATLANGLLWIQIVVGAALTACGASHSRGARTATIYLGASSTVIAGLLTYFKSRNQPNRTRQFRNELRNVRNKMDEAAADMRASSDPREAHAKALEIIALYDTALKDSQANYPDLWVPSILRDTTSKPNLEQGNKNIKKKSTQNDERNASRERGRDSIIKTQVEPHDTRRKTTIENEDDEERPDDPLKEKHPAMEGRSRPELKHVGESQDATLTSTTIVPSETDAVRSADIPAPNASEKV